MEFNLQFEIDLVNSLRYKISFLNKFLPQFGKTNLKFSSEFFLLCHSTNRNGYILVTINGQEEKHFIDNLDRFLEIQTILNRIIFKTHPNKIKKFDRKKNIKVEIRLEGEKRPRPILRRLSF